MNDELRSLGSVRARGIILLIAVAIAGGAAGGALDRWWVTSRTPAEPAPVAVALTPEGGYVTRRSVTEPGRALGEGEDGIPSSLRGVELTDDQKTRIRALTAKYQPVADSLMRDVLPRVRELDLRMRQEAMCVLTPKQREDWIAWRRRERLAVEENGMFLKLVNAGACPAQTGAR